MLQIVPFLAWLAAVTSAALLALSWSLGEFRRRTLAVLVGWFLVAGYCQFLSGSAIMNAVGLSLQTILAAYLLVRFRVNVG